MNKEAVEGILLVDKPVGKTSFSVIAALRRLTGVIKIGHAGTLDPFATGLLIVLIGRNFTKLSDQMLNSDKIYLAEVFFGIETDSYDCDGIEVARSSLVPTQEAVQDAIAHFQGEVEQIPPMFSAKKVNGKKLYQLARKGVTIERASRKVSMKIELLSYEYPHAVIRVSCSKGTYIRAIANDLGAMLGCGAHLTALRRLASGIFHLENALEGAQLFTPSEATFALISNRLILKSPEEILGSPKCSR